MTKEEDTFYGVYAPGWRDDTQVATILRLEAEHGWDWAPMWNTARDRALLRHAADLIDQLAEARAEIKKLNVALIEDGVEL